MPNDHRPPGAYVVNVFFAVFVSKVCTAATFEKDWLPAYPSKSPNGRIDSAGNVFFGVLKETLRSCHDLLLGSAAGIQALLVS